MEMLHTRILCAQVGNRTRDLQATMSMLLQLATKPHPPTIGARQHASDPAKRMHCLSKRIHHSQDLVPHSGDSYHNGSRMDSNLGLLPDTDPANISDSQSTIRYRSNSAMEEDLDDSADTTTPDALTIDTKLRNKLRQRANRTKKRKIARLQAKL